MITIYCLVNPFTEIPFYVGATKLPLTQRLRQHLRTAEKYREWLKYSHNELKHFPTQRRCTIINLLLNSNRQPSIIELLKCTSIEANHYEEFFYLLFKGTGYYLHQDDNRFNYNSTTTRHHNRCTSLIHFNKNN